jgi:hypothetical protein
MTEIPDTNFRLEHGFTVKPDLAVDAAGQTRGILMGRVGQGDLEAIYIGKNAETPFRDVWLDTRGAHVLYVMGKRRSGKSFTLGVIAEGLASQSWLHQGDLQQGVLLVDTMNVYLTLPFLVADTMPQSSREMREVRRWRLPDNAPAVNVFLPTGCPAPPGVAVRELTLRASDLGSDEWCGLFEVDPFADPLGHLMTELYGKVALDGYLDEAGTTHPADSLFTIDSLVTGLDRDSDLQRYHRDTREALRRRLIALRRLPIFSNQGLDVSDLFVPGTIAVLLLRDLDQQLRSALVALIVKRSMQLRGMAEQEERMASVHRARAARFTELDDADGAAQELHEEQQCLNRAQAGLPRSWIVIDEAHNYVPATGVTPARRPIKKYVDEGRNLGLSIVVATQNPAGLDPSIQRNADVLLIHALSRQDDIQAAEGMINTAPPSDVTLDARQKFEGGRFLSFLIRSLPLGYCLAATDGANRLFPVRVRPRVTMHGGADY